jgi:hypothetical protein
MARILISGRGSFGDMFPLYAIAAGLKRAAVVEKEDGAGATADRIEELLP